MEFDENHQNVDFHNFGPPEHSKKALARATFSPWGEMKNFEEISQNPRTHAKHHITRTWK